MTVTVHGIVLRLDPVPSLRTERWLFRDAETQPGLLGERTSGFIARDSFYTPSSYTLLRPRSSSECGTCGFRGRDPSGLSVLVLGTLWRVTG